MFRKQQSLFTSTAFNSYLNVITGLYVPAIDDIITSRCLRLVLKIVRTIGDVCLVLSLLSFLMHLFSEDAPLPERCLGASITFASIQAALKITYFASKKRSFRRYFDAWDASFQHVRFPSSLQALRDVEMRRVKMISIFLVVGLPVAAIPMCMLPLFPLAQQAHGGRFLSVPAWYPFYPFSSPTFELVIAFQSFSAWFILSRSVAFDSFFFSLASLEIAQLQHLKLLLERLLDDAEARENVEKSGCGEVDLVSLWGDLHPPQKQEEIALEMTALIRSTSKQEQNNKIIQRRLKRWVNYHEEVIRLGSDLQQLYSPMFLMQFATCILILCFTSFVVVAVRLDAYRYCLSAMFVMTNMTQLFIFCDYGDRIASASLDLSVAAYGNGWHKCQVKEILSSLKIICFRAQISMQLTALGVFPLTAETFVSVVKTAFSYLMVLIEVFS